MGETPDTIKKRILLVVKHYKYTKSGFFPRIGMTYGNFKGHALSSEINATAVAAVLSFFPDVSADWLLKGEGQMLKSESLSNPVVEDYRHSYNTYQEKYIKLLESENELLKIELKQKQDELNQKQAVIEAFLSGK